MIDEGELDWKIVAISLDDPRASLVNDVEDVEKHFPVCNSIWNDIRLQLLRPFKFYDEVLNSILCNFFTGNSYCNQGLVQRLQDTRWETCQQIWPWKQASKQGIILTVYYQVFWSVSFFLELLHQYYSDCSSNINIPVLCCECRTLLLRLSPKQTNRGLNLSNDPFLLVNYLLSN